MKSCSASSFDADECHGRTGNVKKQARETIPRDIAAALEVKQKQEKTPKIQGRNLPVS